MAKSYGLDISHWQGIVDWTNIPLSFVFIKCGGGDAGYYTDLQFKNNKAGARKKGLITGYYWFAGHNDPVAEADKFVDTVGDIAQGELLALDAETGQSPLWCLKFLQEVEKKVGFKPLIYAPVGNGWDWSPVYKNNNGLWVARYGLNTGGVPMIFTPKIGPWTFYVVWQYTSRGRVQGINGLVDLDLCNCDLAVLKKYGKN